MLSSIKIFENKPQDISLHFADQAVYSFRMPTLGKVVQRARKARGLKQEQLAEAVGKSVSWVGMLETGKVDRLKNEPLRAIASALQIPVEDLLVAMGQLEEPSDDPSVVLQRIAGMPTAEERLAAVDQLPEPVFQALAVLTADLIAAKSEQLEELVRRLRRDQQV